jgi:asparagine synthase (glutamine-hydrolysing)
MCGIAGIISLAPATQLDPMLRSIEHRGRDDEGVWRSQAIDGDGRRVCLGHRRLAIIDTSPAGHQPMVSADGRYVISLNGEIYNYRELREELRSRGHRFRSETDTEVLLAAFAEWGTDCLQRLNGMFAFALWDDKEQALTLARDRVGIKPLYYAVPESATKASETSTTFVFASEVKAILASGALPARLNPEGLHQFLTFLWVPDPNTLFAGVRTVPPGHFLTFRNGTVAVQEWWDVSFAETEEGRSEDWWREQILETLDRVVKMEMVADVPLGSFLSGGIDSSAIVAMMKPHRNGRRVATYTIGIEPEDLRYDIIPDDVRWARSVKQYLDVEYHEIMLKPAVAELLPKLVYQMDQPAADMAIPSYLVSQAARETLTVMLSGMGGDEVFAGYPRQLAMKIAGALDVVPTSIKRPLMKTVASALPGGLPGKLTAPLRNAKKFARSAALDFEERYLGFGTYFDEAAKRRLYGDELRAATQESDAFAAHRRHFARVRDAAPLNQLLYVDLKTFLPCHNLMITDKTSMAATLEVRVPFLNQQMIELAARIPADLKLRGLTRKYILKRALEGVLPAEIIWRRKAGFGAPIRSWLRGPLRALADEMLSEETVTRRGLFQPSEVKRIIEANLAGREDYGLQVFQLLTLEIWFRTFIDD